jgi:hypothetical protein
VVTRNLRHFTPTGVATLDPWQVRRWESSPAAWR